MLITILASTTIGELCAIVGAVATILTVVLVPLIRKYTRYSDRRKQERATIMDLPNRLDKIDNYYKESKKRDEEINYKLNRLQSENEETKALIEEVEVGQLRYYINDIIDSGQKLSEVSDERLQQAAQYCEIYIGRGHNHTTGSKCKIIYEELEKRQRAKRR